MLPGFGCGLRNRRLRLRNRRLRLLAARDEREWALPLTELLFQQLVGELAFALLVLLVLLVLRAPIVFVFRYRFLRSLCCSCFYLFLFPRKGQPKTWADGPAAHHRCPTFPVRVAGHARRRTDGRADAMLDAEPRPVLLVPDLPGVERRMAWDLRNGRQRAGGGR